MTQSKVRKADSHNTTEMDAVYSIGFDSWNEGHDHATYLLLCRKSRKYAQGTWWVLEEDGIIKSSLIVYELYDDAAGLGSIATHPRFQKKGCATKLIKEVIGEMTRGTDSTRVFYLFSQVRPTLYERIGFVVLPEKFQLPKDLQPRDPPSTLMALVRDKGPPPWESPSFEAPSYF